MYVRYGNKVYRRRWGTSPYPPITIGRVLGYLGFIAVVYAISLALVATGTAGPNRHLPCSPGWERNVETQHCVFITPPVPADEQLPEPTAPACTGNAFPLGNGHIGVSRPWVITSYTCVPVKTP